MARCRVVLVCRAQLILKSQKSGKSGSLKAIKPLGQINMETDARKVSICKYFNTKSKLRVLITLTEHTATPKQFFFSFQKLSWSLFWAGVEGGVLLDKGFQGGGMLKKRTSIIVVSGSSSLILFFSSTRTKKSSEWHAPQMTPGNTCYHVTSSPASHPTLVHAGVVSVITHLASWNASYTTGSVRWEHNTKSLSVKSMSFFNI